jgi:phasin family protein
LYQEQFSAATKAQFDAQLAYFTTLAGKGFDSLEKFVDLNLTTAKTAFEESTVSVQALLAAKDAQQMLTLAGALVQPTAEKMLAYSRHVSTITAGFQQEVSQIAESQLTETTRKVSALVDEVGKNAPAGSENVVAMFKSAIASSNAGYEQLSKSTKQAVETIDTNLNNVASQIVQNAGKAAGRANPVARK